VCSSDFNLREF